MTGVVRVPEVPSPLVGGTDRHETLNKSPLNFRLFFRRKTVSTPSLRPAVGWVWDLNGFDCPLLTCVIDSIEGSSLTGSKTVCLRQSVFSLENTLLGFLFESRPANRGSFVRKEGRSLRCSVGTGPDGT